MRLIGVLGALLFGWFWADSSAQADCRSVRRAAVVKQQVNVVKQAVVQKVNVVKEVVAATQTFLVAPVVPFSVTTAVASYGSGVGYNAGYSAEYAAVLQELRALRNELNAVRSAPRGYGTGYAPFGTGCQGGYGCYGCQGGGYYPQGGYPGGYSYPGYPEYRGGPVIPPAGQPGAAPGPQRSQPGPVQPGAVAPPGQVKPPEAPKGPPNPESLGKRSGQGGPFAAANGLPRALTTKCATCHDASVAGKAAQGHAFLDSGVYVGDAVVAGKILAKIINNRMPPPNNKPGVQPVTDPEGVEISEWVESFKQ